MKPDKKLAFSSKKERRKMALSYLLQTLTNIHEREKLYYDDPPVKCAECWLHFRQYTIPYIPCIDYVLEELDNAT